MKQVKIFSWILVGLILIQCSTSKKGLNSVEAFSAYVNDNEDVVAFGKASLESVLRKSDYKNLETVGQIIDQLLNEAGKGIDLKEQVYYAVSGPIQKGKFNDLEIFVPLKGSKEFKKYLETTMAFEVVETKDFKMASDENMAIAIQDKMAILKLSEKIDNPENELKAIIEKCGGKPSSGKIENIIQSSGDLVFAVNAENAVNNSLDVQKMDKFQQQKINEYTKNGFTKTVLNFEDGKAIIDFNNSFNNELMSAMPLKSDNSAPILLKLGSGKPRMGVSINMDFSKTNQLLNEVGLEGLDAILNEILPDLEKAAGFSTGLSNTKFNLKPTKLMSGEFGLVLFGDPDEKGNFDPDYNTHVGLNDNGGLLSNLLNRAVEAMSSGSKKNNGGISYSSSPEHDKSEPLSLPAGANNFGKSGISFFFDLEGFPESTFEGIKGADELQAVLKVAKFISFEYNNGGGSLQIEAKNGKENILKQMMQSILEDQIGKKLNF